MRRILAALLVLGMFLPAFALGESAPAFEASGEGIYNYCPAAFEEDGVRHVYYCTNTKAREVTDSIGYRRATLVDGRWRYGEEKIVLEHTKHWVGWDTVHVCDPDVIKGEFRYKGETYAYLMAFLGCTTTNNQENEIGLAVAKAPEGPFVKIEEHNPIVDFVRDASTPERNKVFQWGVGQAALVSLDKAGQVMLLYTSGGVDGTYLMCERWDFGDLDDPKPLGENWRTRVTNQGSVGRDLQSASLNNADAVYDPATGHLYLVADGWPCYIEGVDASGQPVFVSSTVRVLCYGPACGPEDWPGFTLENGAWTLVAQITPADTGFPRNHNPGLVHDPYGWALSSGTLDLLVSVSEVGKPSNSLWTYRVHPLTVDLSGE